MAAAHATEQGSFAKPEEVRDFPHGRAEILTPGGSPVGRLVFEPAVVVDFYGASNYAKGH